MLYTQHPVFQGLHPMNEDLTPPRKIIPVLPSTRRPPSLPHMTESGNIWQIFCRVVKLLGTYHLVPYSKYIVVPFNMTTIAD